MAAGISDHVWDIGEPHSVLGFGTMTINETFSGGSIELDGQVYDNCTFIRCELVYRGGGDPPLFGQCFFDSCEWRLDGAAFRTHAFFGILYQNGLGEIVDRFIEEIRRIPLDPLPNVH
jgi:hypothetical protein